MTDGNTHTIAQYLDERDALQEVTVELEQAEARIEELEAKLAKAVGILEHLNFDFECIIGRELKGETDE